MFFIRRSREFEMKQRELIPVKKEAFLSFMNKHMIKINWIDPEILDARKEIIIEYFIKKLKFEFLDRKQKLKLFKLSDKAVKFSKYHN